MMKLESILKMFGIAIPPEHIKAVEEIFPHLPGILKHCIGRFNGYHEQLEQQRQELIMLAAQVRLLREVILEGRNGGRDSDDRDTIPAGVGAYERSLGVAGTD